MEIKTLDSQLGGAAQFGTEDMTAIAAPGYRSGPCPALLEILAALYRIDFPKE
jgi:hypothetical protein